LYSRTSVQTTLYYYVIISFHCTIWFLFWFCSSCYFNSFFIYHTLQILFFMGYSLYILGCIFDFILLFPFSFNRFLPKFVVLLSFHRVFLTISIHNIRLYTFRVTLASYKETQKHKPMQATRLSQTLLKLPFVPDRSSSTHILLCLTLH